MSLRGKVKYGLKSAAFFLDYSVRLMAGEGRDISVLVLYLYADQKKYPDTLIQLRKMLRFMGRVTLVRIDNFANRESQFTVNDNEAMISGDNSFWEFSGWRKGLRYAIDWKGDIFDHVLFVNDAFLNQKDLGRDLIYYSRKFNRHVMSCINDHAMGTICKSSNDHFLKGVDVSEWIKSNIFSIPYSYAKQLEFTYLSESDMARIMSREYVENEFLRENSLINSEFKQFIETWLLERWQWKIELSRSTWSYLRGKVMAILNERLLSAELRSMGCGLAETEKSSIGMMKVKRRPAPLPRNEISCFSECR